MRKIFTFCTAAAILTSCLSGCNTKKTTKKPEPATVSTTTTVPPATEVQDNAGKHFLGKWESYKAIVLGQEYETEYAGYPLSAVAKVEIFEDHTATMIVALNPHGKERTYDYSWDVTNEDGVEILHLRNPDDPYDCKLEQGQMVMTYANIEEDTQIFLMPQSEFSKQEKATEPGLENADFSSFMGKWESYEVTSDGQTFTDKLGEYPINAAFRLEVFEDNNAVMSIIGENSSYEWEPDKKDQLYMWRDYEGFTMKITDGKLYLDNENGLKIRLKKVEKFSEYDFNVTPEDIPEEDIILNPEEETETTT